jgi:hypothetical protein
MGVEIASSLPASLEEDFEGVGHFKSDIMSDLKPITWQPLPPDSSFQVEADST